ncbi:unnamed protein product [Ilex paraguariensis]|uniref:ATP-dependent DNA helicase RecQ zinc-binding domain-containing protein n=1 Tax=Ilex paraguariensis TaxID=185542 RepID=A0ABC8RZL6_9AQUA
MEAFYQESGRAGRDQLPSRSVLYYGTDDRKRMEFILKSAESKKLQSSGSQDGSSKKSIADFNQVVEYCEESNCRRKKILESFGEQVTASLCRRSCDACKHPHLVAKYLEELMTSALRHGNGSSRIYISSSSNLMDKEQFSEFWNHDDDEAIESEEDISDSDDGVDVAKTLAQSSLPSKRRLNDRIMLLQHAEEKYYQNKVPDKQVKKLDKNAISETLRESSKQRLLNALKQIQQQLTHVQIDFEASATILENECHKKYGKVGKSFYLSQVASTVRWIPTANMVELTNRLGIATSPASEHLSSKTNSSLMSPTMLDQVSTEVSSEEVHGSARSETPSSALQSISQDIKLPPVPSFSEFVSSKKSKENQTSTSKKQSSNRVPMNLGKRMRYQ